MKRELKKVLSAALVAGMLAGTLGNNALASEQTDLSQLTFGPGWKIDTSKDYSGSQYKRFDGMEFTRVVNTSGFELPEGMTIDDNDRVWMFELKTGLTPKTLWSANGDAYTQKLNACIASGEIPDLMYVDMNQYYSLIKSGLIADLTDELLEGDHPGIQKLYELGDNKALDVLKVDGRIYGIPHVYMNFDGSPLIWIRQDWMDQLGLDAPKTYADLEEIALAFMESDLDGNGKDDTYGIPILPLFSAEYGGSGNVCDLFLNVGGAAPGIWQKQEDGTVVYGSLMDGAKDALTLLNDWYQKGIIPSDFATWTADTLKQIVGEDKAGIVFSPWWGCWDALSANVSLDENATWTAYMLPGEEGGEIRSAAGSPVKGIYVVREGFEDPSAFVYAADMITKGYEIDYEASGFDGAAYQTDNAYNPMYGSNPPTGLIDPVRDVIEKVVETGEITTEKDLQEFVAQESDGMFNGTEETYTAIFNYGLPVAQAMKEGENPREVTVDDQDALTVYSNYLAYIQGVGTIGKNNPAAVSTVFQGTTDSMVKYNSFLANYEKEAYTKMIMGDTDGKSVSDYFDSFVEGYLSQGGEEIRTEVQELIGG